MAGPFDGFALLTVSVLQKTPLLLFSVFLVLVVWLLEPSRPSSPFPAVKRPKDVLFGLFLLRRARFGMAWRRRDGGTLLVLITALLRCWNGHFRGFSAWAGRQPARRVQDYTCRCTVWDFSLFFWV